MRNIVIGMALASTALATPAMARNGQWYVALDFGGMVLEDAPAIDPDEEDPFATIDTKTGFDGDIVVGYDFGMIRVETEAGMRRASNDILTFDDGFEADVSGRASALSFMLNGLLDFGPDDGIQASLGGGVGVSRVKLRVGELVGSSEGSGEGSSEISDVLDGSDSGFAWQLIAAVRAPVSNNVDLGLKYRFYNVENLRMPDTFGVPITTRWRSHSIMASLIYNFGAPAEPPPPPPPPPVAAPPPPPPPPVARPVCNKGPFIVFFDWDQSVITSEAAMVLDSAVAAYPHCDRVPVMLAGHADRSGSVRYNVGLSERRNTEVNGYLTARGIPADSITSQAFGESQNRVPTEDGVRELQNRRVEVTYGPGSGW